ncbi:MAG: hypothetical protein NMNS01_00610 [Nitrosomonas sp.]|jgi:entericidin B|nr:MAG: hypothetical protein NMNS01_00610 [Nitrosomonas sp.]
MNERCIHVHVLSPHNFTIHFKGKEMKIFQIIIILYVVLGLTACNTMSGAGQDIQEGGEALERSAQ